MTDAVNNAVADPLRLEVVEEPLPAELNDDLRNGILAHPLVRTRWPNADLWIVSLDSFDKTGPEDEPYFRAILARVTWPTFFGSSVSLSA